MTTDLGKLQRVPLRKAWQHEASDFTPWLAEETNLNALADALSLGELELVATEHPVGGFKLDILCTDDDGQVIIENQLEKTNHSHLGQIMAYAAGVEARKVIWIAEGFRSEHAAALEYLNDYTTDELSFFGIEVELWRIGDSPLAPKFEVVVKPNDWTKTSREQARTATTSTPTKQLQLRLWKALLAQLAEQAPAIRPQKPRPQHWLNNTIGRSGFRLNFTVNSRESKLGVELYLSRENASDHFEGLHAQKDAIENKLGFALDWQALPDAQACRIAAWLFDAPITDEQHWPSYLNWYVQTVVKMDKVFRPVIRDLP